MKRLTRTAATALFLAATCAAAAGCPPRRPADAGPAVQPNPQPAMESDATTRVDQLRGRIADLSGVAGQLPGADEAGHRRLMADVFARAAEILPGLGGPDADAAFRQQLQMLTTARSDAAGLSPALSADPSIAAGARAMYAALNDLNARQFSDQPPVLAALAPVGPTLDGLDLVRGPARRQAVADAVRGMVAAMREMDDALAQRLAASRATTRE